jgi:hypothetical protein
MQYNIIGPKNYGLISAKFSESDLAPIKSEINNIQNNFELYESQKYNNSLAGNIKREYQLLESQKYIQELLMPLVGAYDKDFDYMKNFNMLTNDVPIALDSCWVNFQKKYEFNPLHNHGGMLSFVIWTHVPYDMEDERKLSPGVESNYNSAGMFSFLYNDSVGGIKSHSIPVDKSMENKIILFPSSFFHMVYPFFSSDGYRISVSGNFKLKVD